MILVTTTPSVDGYPITNYQGIVFGEVVSGVNMFKDLGAGLRNMFGGRSQGYEEELMRARNEAIGRAGGLLGCPHGSQTYSAQTIR